MVGQHHHTKYRAEGGENVERSEIKKILSEQLQLLAERSKKSSTDHELCELTREMVELAQAVSPSSMI